MEIDDQLKLRGRSTTFRMVAERWTSGDVHREYPDQVRAKRTSDEDARTLANHIYPHVGNKPIADITLDDCERVMRALPSKLRPATRRNIGALI